MTASTINAPHPAPVVKSGATRSRFTRPSSTIITIGSALITMACMRPSVVIARSSSSNAMLSLSSVESMR